MEKNNQSVDIKSLSKEQRAALMAQLQQEEKEDRIARRETYEALRGEFMHEVKTNVLEMVNAVTGFRGWLEKEADAFTKVMKEYGQVKSDEQRSYTITDGDFRLEVKSNKVKGFDERADMAADRLIDYLKRYVSRSPQENIVIEKFADYWDSEHQAYLDKVTFKVAGDSNAIVTGLKGGSIDMYPRINSTESAQLAGDKELAIYQGGMNLIQALYLNNKEKPFDDVKVRQAMCYAVNRQEVLDMMANGKGTIIGSSMFPAFEKYYMPELADRYPQDIEKAKQLLKEAGYPDGFEMTMTVPNNYQQHIDTAQVLAEQLKQVGIDAKIQLVEWDSWLGETYAERKFQSTVVGIDAAYLSGRALLERFTSQADTNFINYSNPEYDRLYEQVRKSTDEQEQIKLYQEMETLLSEDAANVYIQDMASEVVLRKDFGGYVFYPLYVLDMAKIYKVK